MSKVRRTYTDRSGYRLRSTKARKKGKKSFYRNTTSSGWMNDGGFGRALPRKTLVYRGGWGRFMPDRYFTYLSEAELWPDTTAGGAIDYIIKANSAYDPWDGLSTNSMMGFDNMMGIYHNYKVHSCRVDIEVVNNDGDDPVNIYLIPMWTSTTQAARGEETIALPNCKSAIVTNQTGPGRISCYVRMKDVLSQTSDLSMAGTASTDPTQLYYIHVVFANRSGNALAVEAKSKITMFVEFFNPSYIFAQ